MGGLKEWEDLKNGREEISKQSEMEKSIHFS
jgi:hypothetical protein